MKKNTFIRIPMYFTIACSIFMSCTNENADPKQQPKNGNVTTETKYANKFAKEILEYYYYWNEEIKEDLKLLNPDTNDDPIATVDEIKYHVEDKYIDKWTMLTNDMESFTSSVGGTSKTYGYQPIVYRLSENSKDLVAAIAYVSKDSPAEEKNLKRGDIIYKINDTALTLDNYQELFYSDNIKLSLAKLNGKAIEPTGVEVTLASREMYENPVLHHDIIDVNGKKVGYLAYSSFDLKSIGELVSISKEFKAEGVKDLILDLRYNGGGYVITENVMASMYAPQTAVSNKEIFEKEDFNEYITEMYRKEGISTVTRFTTEYNYPDNNINISTKDANIGLEKVYGIISGNSASASEALLGGLMPYMDVEIIGQQSHGKYCTGWMISAEDAYESVPREIRNWGIYVMASLYKNANDETPCMPDGIIPDIEVADNPMESFSLGDENEAMLKVALERIAGTYTEASASRSAISRYNVIDTPKKANFGKRILLMDKQESIMLK